MAGIAGGAGTGLNVATETVASAAGTSNIGVAILVIAVLYLLGDLIKEGGTEWPIDVDGMEDEE